MDKVLKNKVLGTLDQHRLMTVATNRPDGWPRATIVGYVNDGLTLYFLCSSQSQKAQNMARDSRISLTIDHDTSDPMAITGLSMATQAQAVTDPTERAKALDMLRTRFPNMPFSRRRTRRDPRGSRSTKGDLGARLFEGIWTLRSCA
jgi:nitroimidazol reductase NimA-like FMN-containing flavoprotein (pyridoxamine 5'-phosphate oxidase superfamily)